jgi:hypothetical protein
MVERFQEELNFGNKLFSGEHISKVLLDKSQHSVPKGKTGKTVTFGSYCSKIW